MRHGLRYWFLGGALVCCCFFFNLAQDESRKERPGSASAADEAVLRALAQEFYAAYAKKDLDGFLRLWNAKSPEFAARRQTMQKLFADHERIDVKDLAPRKMTVEGERAKLRVEVEMNAIEAKTGKPSAGFGKMIRALQCVKEERTWKVWREAPAEEELAAALIAAKTEQGRAALMSEEKELATAKLALALIRQGNHFSDQAIYAQALTAYRLGQSVAELIGDKDGVANALHGIGRVHSIQGNYGQALEHCQKSLAIFEVLDNKEGMVRALSTVATIYRSQGDYGQALEYYQRGLAMSEAIGIKLGIALGLANIGIIHRSQGNHEHALEYLKKSLAIFESLEAKPRIANALNSIGNVYLDQGNYGQALEYYQKSLAMSEALGQKDAIAIALLNTGEVYRMQGAYGQGLEYLRRSLAAFEDMGRKEGIALALNNIGNVHIDQDDYEQALEYHRKSLAMSETIGNKSTIARTLNNIGVVHRSQGDYEQALEYYRRSLALREELDDKTGISIVLSNMGGIHAEQGRHSQALDFAERAGALAQRIGAFEVLWQARLTAGVAYRALKQPARARQAFDDAIHTIETMRAQVAGYEQAQQRFFESKVSPYYAMVELLAAQNQIAQALSFAERARARALLDVLRSGRINVTKTMTASEREQERGFSNRLVSLNTQISTENLRPQPDHLRLNDLKAQLQKVRLDYEAFQTGLYAAHPELKAQRGEAEPLTLEQARETLPDTQSALLEYVVTDERTYLFALTGNGAGAAAELKVYPLEIKRKELSGRAAKFRETLAKGSPGFRQPARELYDLLLKPAATQLQGKTSLVIVPDGALWELPFQALLTAPNRYLIDDCAIAYAPSLTALREMVRLRDGKKDSTGSPTLLAFGNPALGKQTIAQARSVLMDEKLDPLPEAERQVNTLKQIYGAAKSKIYIGAEAREERAKAEAGAYRILHLATHGVLNDVSPMYSRVLLAQPEGDANEDGLLEAWEIMKLDLKADLAVLSACETARGRVGAGEGMIGLSWALFVAGCPTAVVSQWKVESASTTELMLEFHRQLKSQMAKPTGGFSAARALREAALKLQRTDAYRHPFYWAGFVAAGKGF